MKKVLKRSLSVLLAITIIFSSAYVGLGEIDFSKVNFNGFFAIKANAASSGTCGDNLTWTLDDNGTLTISGTGNMTEYSSYSSVPWYPSRESIKTVVINSGVTSIGYYAFYYCTSLTSVIIPDSVTSIGDEAFFYCTSLTSVTIPDSVTSIGNSAFTLCSNLSSITIADSVTYIGSGAFEQTYFYNTQSNWENNLLYIDNHLIRASVSGDFIVKPGTKTISPYAFEHCTNLTSISIPESVTYIGTSAFSYCSSLTKVNISDIAAWCEINFYASYSNPLYYAKNLYLNNALVENLVIPEGVKKIGDYAFCYCSSLTSVTIPDSVTSIGDYAFDNCSNILSITIPDSVTSIGVTAFRNTAYYNDTLNWENNLLYIDNHLIKANTEISGDLIIKPSTKSIASQAFSNCSSLTSVTIPDSVTSIGDYTFSGCWGLTSVNIPDSVTSIGKDAFSNCRSLTSITIPDGVPSIGKWAFSCCTSLTSITIPNSVTSIDKWAFNSCTSLTYITIPDGVTSIGYAAFYSCKNLTSVTIPVSVTSIGEDVFYSCTSLTDVYYIGTEADWANILIDLYNTPLTNVTIHYIDDILTFTLNSDGESYSVTACDKSFSGELVIPSTYNGKPVTSIGDSAFYKCTGLTSITIPVGVTSIGNEAFYECETLTSITIPDSVASIGTYAFAGCKSLISVTIPDGVTSIEGRIFSLCSSLASIIIPDSVTSIGYCAFESCKNLTSITIPNSVKEIHGDAFFCCSSLKTIKIPDGITTIYNQTFMGCRSLTSVTIPNSVTSIGNNAFDPCPSLTDVYYGGTKAEWANISIGSANAPLKNATIHYIDDILTFTLNSDGESYSVTACDKSFSGELVIPATYNGKPVTSIGNEAFYECTNLTSITIPESVTSLGEFAFYGCSSLISISIPDSVKYIGYAAFRNCSSLLSIEIPYGVWSISFITFAACESLTSITIPDSVRDIDQFAFAFCTNLKSITIPDSVTSIGIAAFQDCSSLTDVYYGGTADDWANISIDSNNTPLTNATIHYHEHTYNSDWIVDAEPTCTEAGSKHTNCSTCGDVITEEIPATGHQTTEWITEKEPTCTESGHKDEWCLDCGEIINTEEIPATGHLTTEWITEKEPTCTESGHKDEWCLDCFEIVNTEEIPATGHIDTEWITEKEPTCTEAGYKDEWCLDCGELVGSEEIPAKGHSYSDDWTIDIEPTCTDEGIKSRHCTVCDGSVTDVIVIVKLGHKFEIISTADEHPHTTDYKCSRCPETKTEDTYSEICGICNFTYTDNGNGTCTITGYIGSSASMFIPATIDGKTVATTTTGAFSANTSITSVVIEDGVQNIGNLAFLGCSSLSKAIIPESVTFIGKKAFHSCSADLTIYCYSGSFAMQYAIDNSINYVVMDILETENSTIDYTKKLIFATVTGAEDITEILNIPEASTVTVSASLVSGNNEYLGTGSLVTVISDGVTTEYTLIVEGDTNGDSVCNVLDVFEVERASNGHIALEEAYALAADSNSDDVIDMNDYQSIVNKALAS